MPLLDIRYTVRIGAPVRGADIIDALRHIAGEVDGKYIQQKLYEIDGEAAYRIGIDSRSPFRQVMVRTGDDLEGKSIRASGTYTAFGVSSASWDAKRLPVPVFADDDVRHSVESVRDGLERILMPQKPASSDRHDF